MGAGCLDPQSAARRGHRPLHPLRAVRPPRRKTRGRAPSCVRPRCPAPLRHTAELTSAILSKRAEGAGMDLELHGRRAVVTGASDGIGLAVARALTAEGVQVVGAGRRTDGPAVSGVEYLSMDLAEPGAPDKLVAAAV